MTIALECGNPSSSTSHSPPSPSASVGKPSLRKHRCWQFHVGGITNAGDKRYETDVLLPFRQRYTSATRLVLSAIDADGRQNSKSSQPTTVCVEVQFSGPQPCLGPGSLLCALLAGTTVKAHPVQLERGRKKKQRAGFCALSSQALGELDDGRPRKRTWDGTFLTAAGDSGLDEVDVMNRTSRSDSSHTGSCVSGSDERESIRRAVSVSDGIDAICAATPVSPPLEVSPVTLVGASSSSSDPDSPRSDDSDVCSPSTREESPIFPARAEDQSTVRTGSVDLLSIVSGDTADYDFPLAGGHWVGDEQECGLPGSSSNADALMSNWAEDTNSLEAIAFQPRVSTVADWEDVLQCSEGGGGGQSAPGGAVLVGESRKDSGVASQSRRNVQGSKSSRVEDISIELLRLECDFDGRAESTTKNIQPWSREGVSSSNMCPIVVHGLESAGHDPRMLTLTVHFWIGPKKEAVQTASPLQMNSDGQMCAEVCYPSMQKLWPDVHKTTNIRTVEVDAIVYICTRNREFEYFGPKMKVTYRRSRTQTDERGVCSRVSCRRISAPSIIHFSLNTADGAVTA